MYQEANEANKTREVGGRRSWWIKQNGRRCEECALSRSIKLRSKGFTKKLQTKSQCIEVRGGINSVKTGK